MIRLSVCLHDGVSVVKMIAVEAIKVVSFFFMFVRMMKT